MDGNEENDVTKIVFELIINADMLPCNQNGVTGELVKRFSTYATQVDVWKTSVRNSPNEGRIGVFNRNPYLEFIEIEKENLGLNKDASYCLFDIWGKNTIEDKESFVFEIPGNDVVFIKYNEN